MPNTDGFQPGAEAPTDDERFNNRSVDMQSAGRVEFACDSRGKVWVNVDGVCRLRIHQTAVIRFDLHPLAPSVQAGKKEEIQEAEEDLESLGSPGENTY